MIYMNRIEQKLQGVKNAYYNGKLVYSVESTEEVPNETPTGIIQLDGDYPYRTLDAYTDTITETEANNIISWQMLDGKYAGDRVNNVGGGYCLPESDGGWDKNILYSELGSVNNGTGKERAWDGTEHLAHYFVNSGDYGVNSIPQAWLDNEATTQQILMLASYWQTDQTNDTVKTSILKGIDFVLRCQLDSGGYPQSLPAEDNPDYDYINYLTYNDDCIGNVLELYDRIIHDTQPFGNGLISESKKAEVQVAYDKDIQMVIDTQYKQSDIPTIWGSQYSNISTPDWARNFEPPSLDARASALLLEYLMTVTPRSDALKASIHYAVKWFQENVMHDTVYNYGVSTNIFTTSIGDYAWHRFNHLSTNVAVYGKYYQLLYNFDDVEESKKTAFGWGTDKPTFVMDYTLLNEIG